VLLVLLALLLVRIPTFVYPILDEDEAIHATIGAGIVSGLKPYTELVDGKTPLLWYQYAAVFKLFGLYNMFAVHALTFVLVGLTAFLLYRSGTLLCDPRAGFFAALLFVLYSTASFYKILASNFELHFLPWETLAIWLALRARGHPRAWWHWLGAGVAVGLATLTKQQAGIILVSLPVAVYWLDRHVRAALKGGAVLVAGFLATLGIFVAFARSQGFYDDMVFWTLSFPQTYIEQGTAQVASLPRTAGRIGLWILSSLPLWLAGATALRERSRPAFFAVTLLAFSFIPVSLGARFFAHYFLMNLPGLCLLAAPAFARLWSVDLPVGRRRLALGLTVVPPLLFLAGSLAMPMVKRWEGLVVPDFQAIGKRVATLTTLEDRIFVWGWAPEIYVASGRLPAARFVFTDALSGRIPGSAKEPDIVATYQERLSPACWEMLWRDFEKKPPRLIIDSAAADIHEYAVYPLAHYALQDYVEAFYEPVDDAPIPMYQLKADAFTFDL
jgi:4-amino-4-deoxy-L-arabinose transferase-like glycosyltransferase